VWPALASRWAWTPLPPSIHSFIHLFSYVYCVQGIVLCSEFITGTKHLLIEGEMANKPGLVTSSLSMLGLVTLDSFQDLE
jgi:hypothetical protein